MERSRGAYEEEVAFRIELCCSELGHDSGGLKLAASDVRVIWTVFDGSCVVVTSSQCLPIKSCDI